MNTTQTTSKVIAGAAAEESAREASLDLVIVEEVKAGNVSAFDRLIKKYRERLYSIVYNITSNREDAADLTQEAFIKAYQSINKFQGKSSFYTWLYRIAVNTTITYVRKNRLRQFFSFDHLTEEGVNSEVLDALMSKNKADKSTFLNELQEKLNEALQTLSIKHRTAIVLFEIEGLSHQEIAEIMGCSEGTVRSRLHYAKHKLQKELKEYVS